MPNQNHNYCHMTEGVERHHQFSWGSKKKIETSGKQIRKSHFHIGQVGFAGVRPGLILIVNHDYIYSIEIFFNRKLFINRRFLRLKLILFLFEYFSKMPVIVIDFMNKFRLISKICWKFFSEKKESKRKKVNKYLRLCSQQEFCNFQEFLIYQMGILIKNQIRLCRVPLFCFLSLNVKGKKNATKHKNFIYMKMI